MAGKRLYKARGQRMVCGVCGGLAEYFGIDPTLVRLAFLLLAAGWGSGLLAYIVAAIIIPEPPQTRTGERGYQTGAPGSCEPGALFFIWIFHPDTSAGSSACAAL